MQELSKADHRVLRGSVIEMVLGTDMRRHFNILSRFQVSLAPQRLVYRCCESEVFHCSPHPAFEPRSTLCRTPSRGTTQHQAEAAPWSSLKISHITGLLPAITSMCAAATALSSAVLARCGLLLRRPQPKLARSLGDPQASLTPPHGTTSAMRTKASFDR